MGDSFEIRGKAYEGRLGPIPTVGPNIRLVQALVISRLNYANIILIWIS